MKTEYILLLVIGGLILFFVIFKKQPATTTSLQTAAVGASTPLATGLTGLLSGLGTSAVNALASLFKSNPVTGSSPTMTPAGIVSVNDSYTSPQFNDFWSSVPDTFNPY